MDLIALSTLAGILVIVGCIVAVVVSLAILWAVIGAAYSRTRGGTGRREQHAPNRVGRVWRLWQDRG
jgi:hypothetical protein